MICSCVWSDHQLVDSVVRICFLEIIRMKQYEEFMIRVGKNQMQWGDVITK